MWTKGSRAKGWHHSFWDQSATLCFPQPDGRLPTPEEASKLQEEYTFLAESVSHAQVRGGTDGMCVRWGLPPMGTFPEHTLILNISFPLTGWSRTKTVWRLPQWLDCITIVASNVSLVKGENQGKYLHTSLKSPVEIQSHLVLRLRPKQRKFQDVSIIPWEGYKKDHDL